MQGRALISDREAAMSCPCCIGCAPNGESHQTQNSELDTTGPCSYSRSSSRTATYNLPVLCAHNCCATKQIGGLSERPSLIERPAVVACGKEHTAAISGRGQLFTWGLSVNGELGRVSSFVILCTCTLATHTVSGVGRPRYTAAGKLEGGEGEGGGGSRPPTSPGGGQLIARGLFVNGELGRVSLFVIFCTRTPGIHSLEWSSKIYSNRQIGGGGILPPPSPGGASFPPGPLLDLCVNGELGRTSLCEIFCTYTQGTPTLG